MKAAKKKTAPFIAKMKCEAEIRGISENELAAAMRMSESTYYRRKNSPDELSVAELRKLAKKLKLEIVITADGIDCKQMM